MVPCSPPVAHPQLGGVLRTTHTAMGPKVQSWSALLFLLCGLSMRKHTMADYEAGVQGLSWVHDSRPSLPTQPRGQIQQALAFHLLIHPSFVGHLLILQVWENLSHSREEGRSTCPHPQSQWRDQRATGITKEEAGQHLLMKGKRSKMLRGSGEGGLSSWGVKSWAGSHRTSWHRLLKGKWHPTPVLLPVKSHGRRSLVGCSPWGH